jgi:hypothetical protein
LSCGVRGRGGVARQKEDGLEATMHFELALEPTVNETLRTLGILSRHRRVD